MRARFLLKSFILIAVGLTAVLPWSVPGAAQDRAIEHVEGDVYRFKNRFHYAMFVVTETGIVVTDPINADAVDWLKAELAKRFDKPVTHMILSHYHGDHASGGEAWGDGITVVAHEKTRAHVEAGDVRTAVPTVTFSDKHTLEVGGKRFELTYLGEGHSDDLIAVVVRPEDAAFVVDAVSPKRVPYRDFPHTDIDRLIDQIRVIEGLDFEVLVPGHSVIGTKQDVTDMRVYIEELKAEVLAGLKAGRSVDDLAKAVTMDKYQDWAAREQWLELNVRGMARWLQETGKVE